MYYNYSSFGEIYKIKLFKNKYTYTDRLAVTAVTEEHEPFSTFTVCIDDELSSKDEGLAFLDENNNPGITEWLEKNGFGHPTGYVGHSGYCTYPEFKFDLDKLED